MTIADFKKQWIRDRLKELKETRGLSGAAVGRRMRLTRSRISQLKRGKVPDDGFIQRFCEAFQFTYPVDTSIDPVDNTQATPREAELIQMVTYLVEENRAKRKDNADLRQMIGRMDTTMHTQANLINSLCDTVRANAEGIEGLRKELRELPARLKIAR